MIYYGKFEPQLLKSFKIPRERLITRRLLLISSGVSDPNGLEL